jgi:hypothetical protein
MSGGKPEPSFGNSQPASGHVPSSDDSIHRRLLDEVLQQTLSEAAARLGQESAMNKLSQVGRQLRGHSFSLDPVLVQVVQLLLEGQFAAWKISPEYQSRVSRQIAETLYDDPVAHDRLESLWNRLVSET